MLSSCDNWLRDLMWGKLFPITYRCNVLVLAADGQQNLPDGHSGAQALGLPKGTPHASLQAISAGA